MGYQQGLIRCNITAELAGGEQMVNTVWLRPDSSLFNPALPSLQAIADHVRASWGTTIETGFAGGTPLAGFFAATTVWKRVDVYSVNTAGRAVAQAQSTIPATTKGSAGNALPPQLAVCVTTLTNTPGRSGRGRIFLGGIATSTLGANGRLTPTVRDNIAAGMANFYINLRHTNNAQDTFRPVVVSPTKTDSHKITKVSVGDVMDTMRSRRNKWVEVRATNVVDAT